MKRFFVLVLLSCQWACTTLTDQGDELYEKGLYVEAEKTYNEALQKDANDTKALGGLQKARVKIIDVGLIEVRMLRLAKNYLVAADKLESLMQKQKSWQVQFTSGIAETQEYESRHSKDYLVSEMNHEVDAGFPERSYWLWQTHKTILEANGITPDLDGVRVKNTAAGKKRCTEFQGLPAEKDIFLRGFVSRYCSIWGTSWTSKQGVDDPWLFSNVTFENQYRIENLNYGGSLSSQALQDAFVKVFRESPYYNPSSKKVLPLRMTGTLSYSDRREKERRRKSYDVDEEWEEKVISKDANGVKKEDKVKKKKRVTKEFHYFVTVHNETSSIHSSVSGTIAGQSYSSNHQNTSSRNFESHNESNHKAGIYPVQATPLDVNAWFASQFKTAASTFQSDLNTTWSHYFCPKVTESSEDKNNKSGNWELIERCGRVENNNQIVDTFYRTRFHLSYSEFWSLLRDERSSFKSVQN